MSLPRLTTADRERMALLHRAAFANPFSRERDRLDARIAGVEGETVDLVTLLEAVTALMTSLEKRGRARLEDFPETQRPALASALLFDAFHRVLGPLDDLIRSQQSAGDDPVAVPFAPAILELLASRGFAPDAAERYLAIFFQMRRAYYFIQERITGQSESVRALRVRLWNNIFTVDSSRYDRWLCQRMEQFSTLLVGDTGTGKGTAAFAIGSSGFIPWDARKGRFAESFTRGFIAINLSQYAETLIESELFGHKKGAFTGAVDAHRGIFSRCSPYGAIFLDEIGELSVPIQIKLLKVLEERAFTPVGGHEPQRFSGRVIAATNRPLDALRRDGRFRDDLYYRLSTDVIRLPTLKERIGEDPDELPRLVGSVVKDLVGAADPALAEEVRLALAADPGQDHEWPGNVRELQQAVRRVLLSGRYVHDPAAPGPGPADAADSLLAAVAAGSLDADTLLRRYARRLHSALGSYKAVADRLGVDQRTARRWIDPGSRHAGTS